MATSHPWAVYDAQDKYQGLCAEIGAAANLVTFYGEGATIRHGKRKTVWVERDSDRANDLNEAGLTQLVDLAHIANRTVFPHVKHGEDEHKK